MYMNLSISGIGEKHVPVRAVPGGTQQTLQKADGRNAEDI